jgi:hypothetical protein
MSLSKSNWAINTDEPLKAVLQKLKSHIQPQDYVLIFPLDARLLTPRGYSRMGIGPAIAF